MAPHGGRQAIYLSKPVNFVSAFFRVPFFLAFEGDAMFFGKLYSCPKYEVLSGHWFNKQCKIKKTKKTKKQNNKTTHASGLEKIQFVQNKTKL